MEWWESESVGVIVDVGAARSAGEQLVVVALLLSVGFIFVAWRRVSAMEASDR